MPVTVRCQQASASHFEIRFNTLEQAVCIVICYAENERACSISLTGMAAYNCVISETDNVHADLFVCKPGKSPRETFIDILRARGVTSVA